MKLSELLWIVKICNLNPIDEIELKYSDIGFVILSSDKRIDIWNDVDKKNNVVRYIRIYGDSNDLNSYFQTELDNYLGKSEIDKIRIK